MSMVQRTKPSANKGVQIKRQCFNLMGIQVNSGSVTWTTPFASSRIVSDSAKFHAVVAALDMSVLDEITDIIENPLKDNKYAELKSKLINRFAEFPEDALAKALSDPELGDSRPTQLLRRMR
ncbi:unnamed protein product [Hermetia illucens]|uniref:DUF7041 domain-containing protein n=1 Tax=Hermetia illucens TaxID=343691 RepID=A0A7R8UJ47_HERIL|nr:unnamed protein product [Hermetia illucens]